MKIKFGVLSSDPNDAAILASAASTLTLLLSSHIIVSQFNLDYAHRTLSQSLMSNWTSSPMRTWCDISYDDCLCSVQLAKNTSLENCLTDRFLLGIRISALLSFILQIFLIRESFTLTDKHSRSVVYSLWTAAVFIFVAIANGVYHSSCFHRRINSFLYVTGMTLFMLVIYDIIKDRDTVRPTSTDYISVNHHGIVHDHIIEISENAPDEPMCLLDLL